MHHRTWIVNNPCKSSFFNKRFTSSYSYQASKALYANPTAIA